jgi:hypothetical protein
MNMTRGRLRRTLTKHEELLRRRSDQAYIRQQVLLYGISATLSRCNSLDELNWLTAIIDTDLRSVMERREMMEDERERLVARENPKPRKTAEKSADQKLKEKRRRVGRRNV